MTRNDFIERIDRWWELIDFCRDMDCSVCEDIIDGDDLSEYIEEDIENAAHDGMGWREIRDRLNDLDTGYSYYVNEGYMLYVGLNDDDDFNRYKDEVIEWMDDYGYWDDEEEDDDFIEEEADNASPFDEDDEESDDGDMEAEFPVTELISLCIIDVTIQQSAAEEKQRKEQAEIDRALAELLPLH